MYNHFNTGMEKFNNNSVTDILRKRIEDYREELLSLLDEWHYLMTVLQPQLLFRYDSLFGEFEFEIRRKNLMSKELDKRISNYLELEIEKNKKSNELIQEEILDSIESNTVNSKKGDIKKIVNSGNYELPSIYRKLVKKLHPDLSDNKEYFSRFWYNVQEAYKTGNLERLRMFHETLCSDIQLRNEEGYNQELRLRNEIRKLRMNISSEKRKIARLKKQPPFVYMDELDKEGWVDKMQDEYKNKIGSLTKTIDRKKVALNRLSGHEWTSFELFSKIGSLH